MGPRATAVRVRLPVIQFNLSQLVLVDQSGYILEWAPVYHRANTVTYSLFLITNNLNNIFWTV